MAHTWSPRRRRRRQALGYLRCCYLPWRTTAVTGVYDLLATRALSDHGLYLNLGCWREACTTDDACQALVHLVAAAAALGPRDRLLDVGFGFAEQTSPGWRAATNLATTDSPEDHVHRAVQQGRGGPFRVGFFSPRPPAIQGATPRAAITTLLTRAVPITSV